MPSPFPGMNPFLEQDDSWEDFHQELMTHARDTLSQVVGPHSIVKVEVRLLEPRTSIEIVDRLKSHVITVIELLSPSNKKPGPDRDEYLRKRSLLGRERTHLVEIDLRPGDQRPTHPPLPACAYYVLVSRWQDRPNVRFWPFGLRDPLPVIPIPLTPPDPDVPLDLQALLHRVYDAADYGKYIYSETPEPPLSAEDAAWAQKLLAATR